MGFIEMLLGSVIPLLPSYERLVSFLVPQGLYEGEVIFRSQGEVSLEVSGSRFNAPFTLEGEFMVPLEGEERGKIVPLAIWADSIDFLPTGNSLFR